MTKGQGVFYLRAQRVIAEVQILECLVEKEHLGYPASGLML